MASRSKNKTTFAKLARESRLRERRLEKQARKEARKRAAENPAEQPGAAEYPGAAEQPGDPPLSEDRNAGLTNPADDA